MFNPEQRIQTWHQASVLMLLNLLLIIFYIIKFFQKKDLTFFFKFSDIGLQHKTIRNSKRFPAIIFSFFVWSSSLALWHCFNSENFYRNNIYSEFLYSFIIFFISATIHFLSCFLIAWSLKEPEFLEFSIQTDGVFTLVSMVGIYMISVFFFNFQNHSINKVIGYFLLLSGLFFLELRRMTFVLKKFHYHFFIYFTYLCTGILLPIYLLFKTIL